MSRPTVHRFWRSPDLPFVESRCANDSSACYAPHSHATLSIGAVDGGHSVLRRAASAQNLVCGDVVCIPAGEVHCCNPDQDGRWSYQMLYLDCDWVRAVVGELPGASPTLLVGDLPDRAARGSIHRRLTQLNALLFGDASPDDKEAALVLFVGDLCAQAAASGAARPAASTGGRLRRVQALIEEHCAQTLRLEEMASVAGMSRYYLLRSFRGAFGMTPHAWQLDLRVQRARRLLDQGMELSEVALQLGFADQSHFQRAFKARVAATPGEYRRTAGERTTGTAILFKTTPR